MANSLIYLQIRTHDVSPGMKYFLLYVRNSLFPILLDAKILSPLMSGRSKMKLCKFVLFVEGVVRMWNDFARKKIQPKMLFALDHGCASLECHVITLPLFLWQKLRLHACGPVLFGTRVFFGKCWSDIHRSRIWIIFLNWKAYKPRNCEQTFEAMRTEYHSFHLNDGVDNAADIRVRSSHSGEIYVMEI